jgi:D-alanyl-D-alanine carboxypeptidase
MDQSQFVNPHGLDEEGQYSSAADIMKLLTYAYNEYPELWEIMQQKELDVVSQSGTVVRLGNSNELIGTLPNMFGGKTGFTNQALETLASIVMIQDRPVGIVVMQAPIGGFRFQDTQTLTQWIEDQYQINL